MPEPRPATTPEEPLQAGPGAPRGAARACREGHAPRLPGVGRAIDEKLAELADTGRLRFHDRLRREVPPSLLDLLAVPGPGPPAAPAAPAARGGAGRPRRGRGPFHRAAVRGEGIESRRPQGGSRAGARPAGGPDGHARGGGRIVPRPLHRLGGPQRAPAGYGPGTWLEPVGARLPAPGRGGGGAHPR